MNTTHSAAQVMRALAMAVAEDEALPESWFDSAPRLSTVPPARQTMPPVERIGGFLGDELADAWLR